MVHQPTMPRARSQDFAGNTTLVRLALRRDRLIMPWWILALAALPVLQAYGTPNLFTTQGQLQSYALTLETPAFVALYGPVFEANAGSLALTRSGIAPVIVALVAAFIVIRHTRTEEESGRTELLATSVVGRFAGLAAALITASVALVLLWAALTAGMVLVGMPFPGSVLVGASYAGAGFMFAGVGAIAAQLTVSAGGARALACAALGVAFAVRLAGDVSAATGGTLGWLSYLSPIGWVHQARPFGGDQWWVLAPMAVFTCATVATAVWTADHRDVGAGVFAPPSGAASAGKLLSGLGGLAWRQHRAGFYGWAAGMALLGLVLGSAGRGIEQLFADNPMLQQMLERIGGRQSITDAYFAGVMGLIGLLAAGYAIGSVLRLRSEESSLRAEFLLYLPVSRMRWALIHLSFAGMGAVLVLLAAGAAMGLAHSIATDDLVQVFRLAGAALAHISAVIVLAGMAFMAFGLAPRFAAHLSWSVLGAVFLIGQVGAVLELDQWLLNLSPFTHVPNLPGPTVDVFPLLAMPAIAGALIVIGGLAWRRRDYSGAT